MGDTLQCRLRRGLRRGLAKNRRESRLRARRELASSRPKAEKQARALHAAPCRLTASGHLMEESDQCRPGFHAPALDRSGRHRSRFLTWIGPDLWKVRPGP